MIFGDTRLLALLLTLPIVALWLSWRLAQRRRRLETFGQWPQIERLLGGARLGLPRLRGWIWLAVLALLVAALARPQFGEVEETILARGVDVIIAVDTSASMLADDIAPTRLARATAQLTDLMGRLRGHRVGLISFAGAAMLQCPLTLDQTVLHQMLGAVDQNAVGVPGTDIADAVRVAAHAFDPDSSRHRVLVLLTDGEDHVGDIADATRLAVEEEVVIHTVGIGSIGGDTIPQRDDRGRHVGFRQQADGSPVLTRLDTRTLADLSGATGGRAFETSTLGQVEIDTIAREINALPRRDLEERQIRRQEDQFQMFVLPAILLLLLEMGLLSGRRAATAAAAMLALLFLPAGVRAEAARETRAGNEAYRAGELETALAHYLQAQVEAPGSAPVNLNIGNVHSGLGRHASAERFYRDATATPDTALRGDALYNLGTAQIHQAQGSAAGGDVESALVRIDESMQTLRDALRFASTDTDAKFNLELAMRLREQWQPPPQEEEQSEEGDEENEEEQEEQEEQEQQQGDESQEEQGESEEQNEPQESEESSEQQEQEQGSQSSEQSQGDEQQQEPQEPSPEEIEEQAQRERAEAYLDLLPFEEDEGAMRNLLGVRQPTPHEGPDW